MGHKSLKRSSSSKDVNEENSPKKLKKERVITINSNEGISHENGNIENNCISNDKKLNKKISETIDVLSTNIEEIKDNNEPKKRKKLKEKKKSKTQEAGSEINNELSTDNVLEIENITKVKKSKKKKLKNGTNSSEVPQGTVEKEKEAEKIGEENDEDIKKKKKPSKRQLKKEKQELREKEKRESTKHETASKALNYISKWKHARSEWKFEKIKQAWLINHLLDEDLVPDNLYPTVLEYFEGCKGMAKEKLVKTAMDVVKKVEKESEESEDVVVSKEYQRARQLLQTIPTDN